MARICNAADRPKPGCADREGVVQRFLSCKRLEMRVYSGIGFEYGVSPRFNVVDAFLDGFAQRLQSGGVFGFTLFHQTQTFAQHFAGSKQAGWTR
jgi:hypothetical protein